MLTRRQYRQTDVLVITTTAALLIALALAEIPATRLGNVLVAVPWFGFVGAVVTLIGTQMFARDDESRPSARVQGVNLVISLLIAGGSYQTVIRPLFVG